MKTLLAAFTLASVLIVTCWATDPPPGSTPIPGAHYVKPHTNNNGTVVPGHFQTNPDGTINNNWSTQGNVNPVTGKPGTIPRQPDKAPSATPAK